MREKMGEQYSREIEHFPFSADEKRVRLSENAPKRVSIRATMGEI
jgi:hypothetical protein